MVEEGLKRWMTSRKVKNRKETLIKAFYFHWQKRGRREKATNSKHRHTHAYKDYLNKME